MDKGIIIGAEHETATRSNLPFVMFRHATSVSPIYLTVEEFIYRASSRTYFYSTSSCTISALVK